MKLSESLEVKTQLIVWKYNKYTTGIINTIIYRFTVMNSRNKQIYYITTYSLDVVVRMDASTGCGYTIRPLELHNKHSFRYIEKKNAVHTNQHDMTIA